MIEGPAGGRSKPPWLSGEKSWDSLRLGSAAPNQRQVAGGLTAPYVAAILQRLSRDALASGASEMDKR
jgi:hypothetical protein